MNVGEYVRTKRNGIGKIISFSYNEDDECCFIELANRRTGIKECNIIKSSPNIIDLVEVGDYVNGIRVDEIKNGQLRTSSYYDGYICYLCNDNEIKSIVTHEQFSQMKYKVGSNND